MLSGLQNLGELMRFKRRKLLPHFSHESDSGVKCRLLHKLLPLGTRMMNMSRKVFTAAVLPAQRYSAADNVFMWAVAACPSRLPASNWTSHAVSRLGPDVVSLGVKFNEPAISSRRDNDAVIPSAGPAFEALEYAAAQVAGYVIEVAGFRDFLRLLGGLVDRVFDDSSSLRS